MCQSVTLGNGHGGVTGGEDASSRTKSVSAIDRSGTAPEHLLSGGAGGVRLAAGGSRTVSGSQGHLGVEAKDGVDARKRLSRLGRVSC